MIEHEFDIEGMECAVCEGGGFLVKLHPNGPAEVACEKCNGHGIAPKYHGYKFNPTKTWRTKEGDILKYEDMSESHIKSCIKMIKSKVRWRRQCLEPLEQALLNKFKRSEGGKILFT